MTAPLLTALLHLSLLGDAAPTAAEVGTVCYDDGTRKPFTADAALWLAKMVDAETWGSPTREDAEWMLWSIVQRTNIWSFKSWEWQRFIQAYSQPINPIWTRNGSRCAKYWADGYTGKVPDSCSQKRVDRRDRNIAMTWADTHATARKVVRELVTGELANVAPGVVGWIAPGEWKKGEDSGSNAKKQLIFAAKKGGNVYSKMGKNPDTTAWTDRTVTIVGPGASCPAAQKKIASKPELGSCERDYGYHTDGRIVMYTVDGEGYVYTMAIADAGWGDRVCDDATGMIYLGEASDAYVTDANGEKVRFRVASSSEHAVTVKVFAGKLRPSELGDNERVVLRKKK